MRKLYLLVFAILLISLAYADNGEKRQNVPLDIIHTVTIGGTPTSSASCNITIFDPDNLLLVLSEPMTANSTSRTYNYTLNETQNSKIGNLCYDAFCTQGSFNSTEHFCIPITTSGKEFTIAESITYLVVLLFAICLFCFFTYTSIKLPVNYKVNEYNEVMKVPLAMKQVKLFFGVMAYMTFVWVTWVFYNLTLAYSQLESVSNFFWFLHRFAISAIIPAIVLYFVFMIVILFKDIKDINQIKRGIGLEIE